MTGKTDVLAEALQKLSPEDLRALFTLVRTIAEGHYLLGRTMIALKETTEEQEKAETREAADSVGFKLADHVKHAYFLLGDRDAFQEYIATTGLDRKSANRFLELKAGEKLFLVN